ncbi:MAG: ATPase, T2SS/T4P/T4SS family, partial [Pseudomonadota bacterium]
MQDTGALVGTHNTQTKTDSSITHLGPLAERLGDVFVAEERLTRADLLRAAALSERSGQPFRLLLDRLGLVSAADWAIAAASVTGLPLIEADAIPRRLPIDPRLSNAFMRRSAVLPLELTAERARFATPDPLDPHTLSALRLIFGDRLELAVASDRDIDAAFARTDTPEPDSDEDGIGFEIGSAGTDDLERLIELANNAPTIRFVETLFAEALTRRATDIHIEPLGGRPRIRFRVDGILVEGSAPAPAIYRGVVSRLKILAHLDVAERRQPQDGRIAYRADNRRVDIRIAIAPTIHGEAVTLRFLDARTGLTELGALAMPGDVAGTFRDALAMPNGLVLVTGPTGSGKTTTLHAALAELNDIGRKIVTIENPVEILTPGLIQIEVDHGLEWTFANALRAILRHDPDVLMVGEIRDE